VIPLPQVKQQEGVYFPDKVEPEIMICFTRAASRDFGREVVRQFDESKRTYDPAEPLPDHHQLTFKGSAPVDLQSKLKHDGFFFTTKTKFLGSIPPSF